MFRSVTRQIERARDVVASVVKLVTTVASALDPRLSSYLEEGESLNGMGAVQLALARWLDADHLELEKLEKAHRRALRKLKRLLLQRDELYQQLYGRMLRIRSTFEDAFGQGKAPIFLGLDPKMGKLKPLVLLRYAREAIEVLSNPELVTPQPVVAGLWENPLQYAEQIRTVLQPFETVLDQIDAQKMEVEVALKAKTEMLEVLQERLTWSIRFFEAIYHLAGLGFHAERLRPKSSRSTSEQEETPPDGEEPEEPAAETAPTEPSATAQETSEATA
jgi:hypothetical protein